MIPLSWLIALDGWAHRHVRRRWLRRPLCEWLEFRCGAYDDWIPWKRPTPTEETA